VHVTIFCKSVQLLAYADDTAKAQPSLKEAFLALEGATRMQSKVKIQYTFEVVQTFTYLGSPVNCNNNNSEAIKK
jgi:hypothetical protein